MSSTKSEQGSERPDKDEYYLDMAGSICERSPCIRRKFGAIVVKARNKAPLNRVLLRERGHKGLRDTRTH